MTKVLFPGSFDPITNGHMDIIKRASAIFDEVVVAVLVNTSKTSVFTMDERTAFIQKEIEHLPNVSCISGTGLTIDVALQNNVSAILRGVRSIQDYEYEMNIAATNSFMNPNIETILMYTSAKYSFVSSSSVKELARYRQDLQKLVSAEVMEALMKKMTKE